MMKKLTKTDILFLCILCACLLLYGIVISAYQELNDETFYISIPLRLINGDSLVDDEWHLTQFSALFTFLPVRLWLWIKGSTEGIVLFSRCLYLSLHTAATLLIYRFFRQYGIWAVSAAIMFFLHMPYRICAISYNSMFAMFILLLSLCLLALCRKSCVKLYLLAGVCYGACCVNNPFFCVLFFLYLFLFVLRAWGRKRRQDPASPSDPLHCLFTRQALLFSTAGIALVAAVSILFFLFTGGTFASLFGDFGFLLDYSEYFITEPSSGMKLLQAREAINGISLGMPYLLPLLFLFLIFDRNRKKTSHRVVYLTVTLLLSILYLCGVVLTATYHSYMFSLPFALFSSVCYILTERKNKILFLCMWCTCAAGAFLHLLASNTLFASAGIVAAVSNVAGVLFARDLFAEMRPNRANTPTRTKSALATGRTLICAGLCLQLLFYAFVIQFGQIPAKDSVAVSRGPFAGLTMTPEQHDGYARFIGDLNYIKEKSSADDPVLIATYLNWMYLYLDRPFAVHTAWEQDFLYVDSLEIYYKHNPENIPKYIYLERGNASYSEFLLESNLASMDRLFEFTRENLSSGVLLTVTGCKFN